MRLMVSFKHIGLIAVHILMYALVWQSVGPVTGFAALVLGALLIWTSCRDVAVIEIPDIAVVLLIVTGVLGTADWLWSAGAALLWAAIYLGVGQAARLWMGRDALGLGDVKLIAGIAAWVGPVAPIFVTLYASLAAIGALVVIMLVRREKLAALPGTGIAFGPFLCLTTWAIWLNGAGQ